MIRDLALLAVANLALLAAGNGVLRLTGIAVALGDVAWSGGVAYVAGAAAVGVLGSALLVVGLALDRWQILVLCAALLAAGLSRRTGLRRPARVRPEGWVRLLPAAALAVLLVLAVDLAVQPIWADDAWSIWAVKAESIVAFDGLDPGFLSSASVFNADYPLVVPVLELVALRFCGLPNELVPLQVGLLFVAFPFALAAVLRDRVQPLLLWAVALALALAPSLQIQTASAVADVPLAVFFALAGVAGWRWVELGESEYLWLSGVFAAAAVGTKVEGAAFVAFLFVALGVAAVRGRRPLRRLVAVAVAVGATAAPWQLWSRAHSLGNAVSDAGGVGSVNPLEVIDRLPRAASAITRELADPTSWLALVALAVVAIALALRTRAGRPAAVFTLALGLTSLAAMLAVYWTTPLDFDYHVATSVRRIVTAPVLFAAAMTPLLLARAGGRQPR